MSFRSLLIGAFALVVAILGMLYAEGISLMVPPEVSTEVTHLLSATSSPVIAPATSTPVQAPQTPSAPKQPPVVKKTSIVPPAVVSPPPTQSDFDSAATALRGALVNIICRAGLPIQSISGSGVVVAPSGIILTNAHIAQYFLLMHDSSLAVSCVIRTGNPARDAYDADLMFISPAWLHANPTVLTETSPSGNGEYDFAFLGITKSATSAPLPLSFLFVPISRGEASLNEPVVIGSYAAQFLSSSEINSALSPTIVFGSIKSIFTFAETTIDVISLGGSAAAQEGSSGGGIVDTSGALAGMITTSTVEGDTSSRNLSAITASYIRREYVSETGTVLETLFAQSPQNAIADFAPQIPALESLIKH